MRNGICSPLLSVLLVITLVVTESHKFNFVEYKMLSLYIFKVSNYLQGI